MQALVVKYFSPRTERGMYDGESEGMIMLQCMDIHIRKSLEYIWLRMYSYETMADLN